VVCNKLTQILGRKTIIKTINTITIKKMEESKASMCQINPMEILRKNKRLIINLQSNSKARNSSNKMLKNLKIPEYKASRTD
jgi:hypothetical protein